MSGITAVDTGIAILRVVAGLTMAAHGYAKIFQGGRLAGTAGWFDSIGMRPGWLHARAAAGTEIGAGLLLAAGLLTPFAGAGFVALMLVAAWTVHRKNGFFIVASGWEYNLVLAAIGVTAGTVGAGRLSLDHALGDPAVLSGVGGFVISAIGGLAAGILHLAVFYRPAPAEATS